ncbi:iron complex transport system ATP-binding protein [Oikeobacillus pervagus]|uniref:Iron complex transport system ATP-binding protein n=1 Tax=Oikeobacillus pervagus TaxID=1325931 RepID=A0AAJ1T7F7_9BACI|nr:ABC transporter ATP-binding protein [Oikeobacillus pervagus]MDQ0215990.1 iron complex transport system ATP-binding protein [Oikeobacillus pervagus]
MGKILSLKGVNWQRNGQTILRDFNWEVHHQEQWGILGLNGSGKTSLLNIVTGYQFPTKGEVIVLDRSFGKTNLLELRKEIGFVSSSLERFDSSLKFETVEEIVVSGKFASIGLYEVVTKAEWEKADRLLDRFRLTYLKGKPYHLLSQGEKRRVLIARSLMGDPKIMILDEPCTGLDIVSREEILSLLKEIVKNSYLLYVTHHIEEISKEITHILLLKDGEIFASGLKKEILNDEILSQAFNLSVKVHWEEDRPWLTVRNREDIKMRS